MRRVAFAGIVAAAFIAGLFGSAAQGAQLPAQSVPSCSGYAEHRVWVTTHSWWIQNGEAWPGRHIHFGACFPVRQTIGHTLHLDLRLDLHGAPGLVNFLRIGAFDSLPNPAFQRSVAISSCPEDTGCLFSVDVPFAQAGSWEIRGTANIARNVFGVRQYQSWRFPVCVVTCSGGHPLDRTGGAGWYGSYQNVYIDNGDFDRLTAGPVSGLQVIHFHCADERCQVSVDQRSHALDPGLILYPAGGGLTSVGAGGDHTITIDTHLLADGGHRLFLRDEHRQTNGISAGQLEIGFTVANGGAPGPTPTPAPTVGPSATPVPTVAPTPTPVITPAPSTCGAPA